MEIDREGIWVFRKITNGNHVRFEGKKIEDLPDIMLRVSFEPYRNIICKELCRHQDEKGYVFLKVKDIIDIIVNSIKVEK